MAGGINPFGFAVSAPQPAPRAPIDLPSAPFGFAPPPSKWEQTAAILNEYNPIDAFWRLYNSDMAKGGAITDQNIEDGLMVGGTVMGGGAMIPKPANALNMGIRAYHGSPHSFDKFSMDKIGTGEGAQAYGHGLYFAEEEGIARHYKDALSSGSRGGDAPHFKALGNKPLQTVHPDVQHDIAEKGIAAIDARLAEIDDILKNEKQNRRFFGDAQTDEMIKVFGAERDELNALKATGDTSVNRGSMYEVNIDADPNAFLDWDKPLSEQPEAVRTALKKLDIDTGSMTAKDRVETIEAALKGDPRLSHLLGKGGVNITGDTLYKGISDSLGAVDWPVTADAATRAQYRSKGATNATQALREAGIPGIKYLDAGSRGAGDGTRNFVVFDDKLISIVRKYGIAGASAMLGYNLLENVNPAQADELKRIEAGK